MRSDWATTPDVSWDVHLNDVLRGQRWEVHPCVSRIQNIGATRGQHVPSPEWHFQNQHVPETADDQGGDVVETFDETGTGIW